MNQRTVKNITNWPIHVKALDDELLSSWITRNALAQLTKVHTFCSSNWPSMEILTRDIDRWSHPIVPTVMALGTSTSIKRASETSLQSYTGILYKEDPSGINRHLLPLGIWHRKRKRYGLCFCPKCLEDSKIPPYYRKQWRLTLSVCCTNCKILLQDCCWFCKSPVVFLETILEAKQIFPG